MSAHSYWAVNNLRRRRSDGIFFFSTSKSHRCFCFKQQSEVHQMERHELKAELPSQFKDGWPLLRSHWPESTGGGENAEVTVQEVETKPAETAVGRMKSLTHEQTNACLSSVLNINSL